MHVLEKIQQETIQKETVIKKTYGKDLSKQLIRSAKEAVNYSYQKERDIEWWVKYNRELESRL